MDLRTRILETMAHGQPDRIPTILDARAEVQEALVIHYGRQSFQEVLDLLETEEMYRFPTDGLVKIHFPGFEERAERVDGPWMGGGQNYIRLDETTFQDAWGVVRRIGSDGKFVEWVSGPLVHASDPNEYDFPGPERIVPDPQLPERIRNWKEQGLFVRALVSQPYKTAWILRGMENLLMDYILNRPFVEKLYDKIYALQGEILPDLIEIGFNVIDPIQPECMPPEEVKQEYGDRITMHRRLVRSGAGL